VRDFEVIDKTPFGIEFAWDKDGQPVTSVLFERNSPIPSIKQLTFYRWRLHEHCAACWYEWKSQGMSMHSISQITRAASKSNAHPHVDTSLGTASSQSRRSTQQTQICRRVAHEIWAPGRLGRLQWHRLPARMPRSRSAAPFSLGFSAGGCHRVAEPVQWHQRTYDRG
jgi:hypothetical protein